MNLDPKLDNVLTRQEYSPQAKISGVEIISLDLHSDDGGNFLEVFRINDGAIDKLSEPFAVAQVSLSVILPESVKAYHLHKNQDDLWFVPPYNRLLVNLHDVRQDSATLNQHQRLVLGGGKAQLIRIPAGVAHGAKNCYQTPMQLFYATNAQFDAENPDEWRLPWDQFGSDVWEITKG